MFRHEVIGHKSLRGGNAIRIPICDELESMGMPSTFRLVKRLGFAPLHATEYRSSILSTKA